MAIKSSHAGHGGKKTGGRWADSGALNVKMGWQEATLAREINDKIIKYTKAKNATDNTGTNSNAILANTSANIRNSGSGWHISNHLNAFNGSAHGVEVLYGADSDKYMAERVAKAISDATGLTNRGAKDGKWLYIANNSGINDKVLLIEWCFIDNKSDVEKLQKNMDKAIQAMLKCFDYDVKIEEVTTTGTPTPPKVTTPQQTKYKEENFTVEQVTDVVLNVRAEPNSTSKIIKTLQPGTRVKPTKIVKNGEKVVGYTTWCNGAGGWISMAYTTPYKAPTKPTLKGDNLPNSGRYTCPENMNIRSGPGTNYGIVGSYRKGQSFNYLKKVTRNGYVWLYYKSYSGHDRYVAVV